MSASEQRATRGPAAPLIAHVVYHFGTGGMENGLVNIINRMSPGRYRHAIVCLTDAGPFVEQITASDVEIVELKRPPGHSFTTYLALWKALIRLSPDIIHTRNLAALEGQIPALFVPGARRVHGEHGRDLFDLDGSNKRYNLLRRAIRPLVQRYIAVSRDLARWLEGTVRVSPKRVRQIYNGVDLERFAPRTGGRPGVTPEGFLPRDALVIGSVGRLVGVKDQATLVRAFARLIGGDADLRSRLRLIIVGEGDMRAGLERLIVERGLGDLVWLPGGCSDVPEMLRLFDLFVLPSLGEGISNTILEAQACALPVVATAVGGNVELVEDGHNGALFPVGDDARLAEILAAYVRAPECLVQQGRAASERVATRFRWERCVAEYQAVYDELLGLQDASPAGDQAGVSGG